MNEEKVQKRIRALQRELREVHQTPDKTDLFGEAPPQALLEPYGIDWDAPEISRPIQKKYMDRARNIQRAWNRLQIFAPELIRPGTAPRQVFEMSTAHGAVLEVCRHFGHDVLGNDYLNFTQGRSDGGGAVHRAVGTEVSDRQTDDYNLAIPGEGEALADWPYRPIIEALGIPMALFDAGIPPYPLPDKSQDVLFCFQAIEHYCHPSDWAKIVTEFCRITRQSIVIYLNKNPEDLRKQPAYVAAFDEARRALRNWNQDGFECTAVHIRWNQALGFKLTATG